MAQAFLNHPAGPKTIFFWAPAFKWALVIAGLADVNRPAHKLSVRQSGALAATGMIWSRYSLVITPKNWNLFSVNVFVACTGLFQLARIWRLVVQDMNSREVAGISDSVWVGACVSPGSREW